MALNQFFPNRPAATPTIYTFASTHPDHAEPLKVDYIERNAVAWVAARFLGWLKRADRGRSMDFKGKLI